MADERPPSPAEQIKSLYEQSETRTAEAFEQLVKRDSFGELLARMTENVVGVTKIATDAFDLVLRNLRLAGRQDIVRLARQLARAEDKLELVLQEVEALREQVDSQPARRSRSSGSGRSSSSGSGRSSSSGSGRSGGSNRSSSNGRARSSSSRRQTSRARNGGDDGS
jgi:uncharacterized membrane protein YgcG